jgi:hypothetical protein
LNGEIELFDVVLSLGEKRVFSEVCCGEGGHGIYSTSILGAK